MTIHCFSLIVHSYLDIVKSRRTCKRHIKLFDLTAYVCIFQTPYYAIKNASCIDVKSGDRVGIFIRKVPGSTTFLYDINAKTLMNKYSDPSLYPALGDLVTFDPLSMPLYFSLRLDLDIGTRFRHRYEI